MTHAVARNKTFLLINVSGRRFELLRSTLERFPFTRLGKIATQADPNVGKNAGNENNQPLYDYYDIVLQEYFFERNPDAFSIVVNYYATNSVHVPRHLCTQIFQEEIDYWGLVFSLPNCCQGYHRQEWEIMEGTRLTNLLFERQHKKSVVEAPAIVIKLGKYHRWRRIIWDLFENTDSSKAAQYMSVFSSVMVIISMIILCISTHPSIRLQLADGTTEDHPNIFIFEVICIVWFTFEYLVRTFTCPSYKDYFKSLMNAIDLLAILPFYVKVAVESMDLAADSGFTSIRRSLQVLRIFRIIRIFKIARHSAGLQVLGYTVKNSLPELGLLLMLLLMGMTLFSSLVYYAEMGSPNNDFDSIIAAFWWAIITMTTVGYGDMAPKTTFGQIIGSVCCLSGILFIALPIPTIVSNFSSFYKDHRNKEKLNKINAAEASVFTENDLKVAGSNQSIASDVTLADDVAESAAETMERGRRVSLNQIERQGTYLRRLSTISNAPLDRSALARLQEVREE